MKSILVAIFLLLSIPALAQPSGTCTTGTFQIWNNVRYECQNATWQIPGLQSVTLPDGTTSTSPNIGGIAASTSTPLAANATWSSGWIGLVGYQSVMQSYSSDVAGTLVFEYSNDGVSAIASQTSSLSYPPAGVALGGAVANHFPTTKARYLRITYTNGASPQTSFGIVIRCSLSATVSGQTLSAGLFGSAIADVTKSVIELPDVDSSAGVYAKVTRTGNALNVNLTNSPSVTTGGLTDAQLRATAVPISGTITANAGTGTMAASVASLPLPTGAATAAKQPALGTAGTPSADVITVQGATAGTALNTQESFANKTRVMKTGTLTTTTTTADQVVLTYTTTAGKTTILNYLDMSSALTGLSITGAFIGTASLEIVAGTKVTTFQFNNTTNSAIAQATINLGGIPVPASTVVRVVCTPAGVTSTRWVANFGGFEQ